MKLYGGKFLRNIMTNRLEQRVESRDALLWDVLPSERKARVKIQGSDTLIVVYFPENWTTGPSWLKPGNAVRISHTGGDRGRIELVGDGTMIPTPVVGGSDYVGPTTTADIVISGMTLRPTQGMRIVIGQGVVRIGGVTSTVKNGIILSAANSMVMGDQARMGDAGIIYLSAAPTAGLARYDAIVINSSLVISVVQGTAAVIPAKPAVSGLLLGYILIPSGRTAILQTDINADAKSLTPTSLQMSIDKTIYPFAVAPPATNNPPNITMTVLDQYGRPLSPSGSGWHITVSIFSGNGMLYSKGASSPSSVDAYTFGPSVMFTYVRNFHNTGTQNPDQSPLISAKLENTSLSTMQMIQLYNFDGILM